MEETLGKLKRTHYCGAFQEEMDGKEVVVNGWCQRMRNLGALIFADLRDRTGLVQVVFEGEGDRELFEKASAIRSEFVLAVRGRVRLRSNPDPEIPTGRVEIVASEGSHIKRVGDATHLCGGRCQHLRGHAPQVPLSGPSSAQDAA